MLVFPIVFPTDCYRSLPSVSFHQNQRLSMAVTSVVDSDEMARWAGSCSSRLFPFWRARAPLVCAATETLTN